MEDKTLRTALLEKETIDQIKKDTPSAPIRQENLASGENLKVNLTKIKAENARLRQEEKKTSEDHKVVKKNQINFFGGEYKIEKPEAEVEPQEGIKAQANSSVIETPNYDLMETLTEKQEEKIFVVEKAKPKSKKRASPLLKKIKIGVFVLLVGVLGSWTVYNAVELSQVVTEYNLKLDQYLLKLGTLDSASGMNDLFPTYPEDVNPASGIEKKSNWFDRLCNFIGGIFGG